MKKAIHRLQGSVTLVALCCVAVIGIGLAGYLAVSSQAMKLSARSYHRSVSEQLAEMGLEEALRAFNKNDWSAWSSGTAPNVTVAAWTVSGTTATCNLTFPPGRYGQDVSGSVKIRVDNYNAANLSIPSWSSSTSYQLNDVVYYTTGSSSSGSTNWYRCVQANTNQAPGNLSYWVPEPIPWTWSNTIIYSQYDLVNYGGVWYRYINATPNAGKLLTDPAFWQSVPSGLPKDTAWDSATIYSQGALVLRNNYWFSYINATPSSNQDPSGTTGYWAQATSGVPWSSGVSYTKGATAYYNSSWYYCIADHVSTSTFDSSKWKSYPYPIALSWYPSTGYGRGALVFYSGDWYYCTNSHTSPGAWDPVNWVSMSSPSSSTYDNTVQYYAGDYVYDSSSPKWYRCIAANSGQPLSNTNYWTPSSPFIAWMYRSTANYNFNAVVYYSSGSVSLGWYRYNNVSLSTGNAPDTNYWENALSGTMHGWASNTNYHLRDVVYRGSSWYRCILAHTASGANKPPNTTYWTTAPLQSVDWDPGKQYNQSDTVRYNGQWYLSYSNLNLGNNPGSSPGASPAYWAVAPRSAPAWDSTQNYSLNDIVIVAGNWYRCIIPNTNQDPTSGTYWVNTAAATYKWYSSAAYSTGDHVWYGGVWYICRAGNTGQSPNNSAYWTALGAPVIYAEGTVTLPDNSTVQTQLRAVIAPAPLFPNALATTSTLTLSSGSASGLVDSYDGSVTALTQGIYSTYAYGQTSSPFQSSPNSNIGYSAILAATGTSSPAVTVTGGKVQGFVAAPPANASPYAPLFSYGGNAYVASATSSGSPKVDPTRVSRSPYIPQFDIQTAASGGLAIPGGLVMPTSGSWPNTAGNPGIAIGTPGGIVPSTYTYRGNLDLNKAYEILNINGPVVLNIYPGFLRVRTSAPTSGQITINNPGSAEIYFSDSLRLTNTNAITVPGGIINNTSDPKRLFLFSDVVAASTAHTISATTPFYGVIYLPNTNNTLTFSPASPTPDFFGAISTANLTFSSYANVHYDTSLRYATFGGVDQPNAIAEWRELTDATDRANFP